MDGKLPNEIGPKGRGKRVPHSHSLGVHDLLEPCAQPRVLRSDIQALFVRGEGLIVFSEGVERGAESTISLGPRGVQLYALFGVALGVLRISFAEIGCAPVAVVDVIGPVKFDGARVVLDGKVEVLRLEGGIALGLELLARRKGQSAKQRKRGRRVLI